MCPPRWALCGEPPCLGETETLVGRMRDRGEELSLSQGRGNLAETRCWHQQAGLSRNSFFVISAS